MSEYWLISAPGDKTCQQTWETMNNLTNKQNNLCENYKFHIPDLKVGTLDQLVGLSDDLGKLDAYVEQSTRKIAAYLGDVLEDQRDKLYENLQANNSTEALDEPSPDVPVEAVRAHASHDNNDHHLEQRHSCTESGYSNGTSSPCCSHETNSSVSGSDRDIDSSSVCVCLTSDSVFGSPVMVTDLSNHMLCKQLQQQPQQPQQQHRQRTKSSSGSSLFCSSRKRIHSSNCNVLTPDPALEHDDRDNHENTFEWWFHRRKSSQKSRSRSSSHICGGTTGGGLHRSSPVSSCCGSQGRSSPDVLELEIYGGGFSGTTASSAITTNASATPAVPVRNGGIPSPYDPISPDDLTTYITRFQWDLAKYPTKQSLRNIADIISKQVGQIDADLKTKSAAYNSLKGNLQNLEKKQTGSLLTRNLADLVKKEHFILDSEYLTTLLVIVPKQMVNDWNAHYEKITDMIVPRSSQLITQDMDYALCTVTLFKKVVDEFKLHARERKFVVREFTYNEEELAAGKNEITKLVTDKKKQFGPLVRWLKVNFSECFCAWIHVKALRVFVESVLRYGLPVNFQAILIHPNKKNTKRLRDVLNQLYSHLDGSAASSGGNADNVDIPGLGFGQSEYYPYVYYKLNVDMVETKV
ncbi:V-type proton ATPase subunit C isoform X2 [Toxorhynchites rutilus septentrionalis]|uniref:V-type proton ATPase subunit C isoform X2 n=1 Tax=Toxorhynchites rutilus septentrionalis TaxID=329112 RepID=UPI0024784C69|nr:V-type proton ATPase subunit C isoform X2 [Toxorhynchites rutilus septentrionalis]